jgi:hypothetical protein
MKIQKLRTNHLENPLGYLLDTLSLSWIVSGKNELGMETKVVVSADAAFEDILFESDWIEESTRWTSNRTSACCRKRATIGKSLLKQAMNC